ncbi:MAG: HPr family phosphocarrier protein [Anaeroplasmataceae bacterium]|nr:HPr family phosphocarrier protein [Anaeroplasmataceae bacterium]
MIKHFRITNESGLHARTATIMVNLAVNYDSEITLKALKKEVDFKSIMGVMSLGLYEGAEIEIIVSGHDEEEAMDAIIHKLFDLHLGKEI